jgi:predicted dienelactone hydrolase
MLFRTLPAVSVLVCALAATAGRPAHAAAFAVGEVHLAVAQDTVTRGDPSGQLHITVWYPAPAGTAMRPIEIGPPGKPLFADGESAPNAPLVADPSHLPLILISHANGSFGMQMSWLGSALAANGYVAAAVDHPGDNFLTGATVQGVTFTWLRATDLSHAIDAVLADGRFAHHIDPRRIGAAGFSFGGNTVLEIAGAQTSLAAFAAYCGRKPQALACSGTGVAELPNLRRRAEELTRTDAGFRAALAQAGASYQDKRVRAVFSIAPAFSPEFTESSLRAISIPVAIVGGFSDQITPVDDNMIPDATLIPNAQLFIFERPVAHFAFIDRCTAAGSAQFAGSCADPGSVRGAVHGRTMDLALDFFARSLSSSK